MLSRSCKALLHWSACWWIALFALAFSGCNRESAELTALREENERLRQALEQARTSPATAVDPESATPGKVDLDLTIAELWSQRFEDNQFRAKQRLDQKQIRVTGSVESVSDRSVTISGSGTRFGSVSLVAQLEESYISRISEGMAALGKGTTITAQGRFLFDKMWLDGATFVDRGTGARLFSKDLAALSQSPDESPRKSPLSEEAVRKE